MNAITQINNAYLAGLVDGEGCLAVRTRAGGYTQVSVEICMTSKKVLDWVKENFGGTVYRALEARENRRQPWHWKINKATTSMQICERIRPFLNLKWPEATAIIILGKLRSLKRWKFGPSEHREAELKIARISKLLKQSGKEIEAYEESMDLCIYLRGVIEERDKPKRTEYPVDADNARVALEVNKVLCPRPGHPNYWHWKGYNCGVDHEAKP